MHLAVINSAHKIAGSPMGSSRCDVRLLRSGAGSLRCWQAAKVPALFVGDLVERKRTSWIRASLLKNYFGSQVGGLSKVQVHPGVARLVAEEFRDDQSSVSVCL